MTLTDEQAMELSRREAAPWAERAQALAAAQVEAQLPLLGELAEIGLEVARAVERAARAWTPPAAPEAGQSTAPDVEARIAEAVAEPDEAGAAIDEIEPRPDGPSGIEGIALAYARVSRAVRLTIALQSKLVKDLEELHRVDDYRGRWKQRQVVNAADLKRAERRELAARAVKSLVYAETPDQEQADSFYKAARGWMETDRYADLLARPMSEVVAQVCKDVGLKPDWARLSEEAWARAEIATGKPGGPLRAFLAAKAPKAAEDEPPDDAEGRFRPVARWRARRRSQFHSGSP